MAMNIRERRPPTKIVRGIENVTLTSTLLGGVNFQRQSQSLGDLGHLAGSEAWWPAFEEAGEHAGGEDDDAAAASGA